MKKSAIFLSLILSLSACSPIPYYVTVEVQKDSDYEIDTGGRNIAVVTSAPLAYKDSALVSEIGMGIAEKIESDKGYAAGTVPVFSVHPESTPIHEPGSLDLVAVQTDSDLIVAVDSLSIGDYIIDLPTGDTKVYSDGSFLYNTVVMLPLKVNFSVYDAKNFSFLMNENVSDSLVWNMLSESQTSTVAVTAKANTTLKRVFKNIGAEYASIFSPQWETQERMIVSFDKGKWNTAYYYARNFKWQEAMDIWLELAKSRNPKKSACAAYNIAVACEMSEQYDIALQWLDYANEKYYFREMGLLRKEIQKAMK